MDDVPKIPEQQTPQQQQVAPLQNPPAPDPKEVISQPVVEAQKPDSLISYTKKRSIIDYFIVLVSVIAFLIWIAVGALYLQNKDNKNSKVETPKEADNLTPSPTQVPQKKYNISAKNGNIININESGEEEVLVNKEDYKMTGISGFIKVSVSPDRKKLCFESWPPSPEPSLFVSNIDGSEVLKVNPNRKGCLWSTDSRLIAYNDVKSPKEGVDLFIFDPASASETLLSIHSATETANPKLHSPVGWTKDNKKVLCEYSYVKTPKVIKECEADIDTKVFDYK